MLIAADYALFIIFRCVLVGIFKKSKLIFQPQHPHNRFIKDFFRYLAAVYQVFKIIYIALRHHINVNACIYRLFRRISAVIGGTVDNRLTDSVVVADDNAVKAHFATEYVSEQLL